MNKLQYALEKWDLGWLICAPVGQKGILVNALREHLKVFDRGAVVVPGIAHHYRVSGRPEVVYAVASPANVKVWSKEITDSLSGFHPEARWWRGVDVGLSSAAIFAVLAKDLAWSEEAREYSNGATPGDADDLGRCFRLMDAMGWGRGDLDRVAAEYLGGNWPAIIGRWAELVMGDAARQNEILREIQR